jgi:hypothetical protein
MEEWEKVEHAAARRLRIVAGCLAVIFAAVVVLGIVLR